MSESPGTLLEGLLDIMARLRGPGGCPWDREQTRASLKGYLIEEAYEALEAIEAQDPTAIEEELGDVLFQVVFHAQIARELGEFTMASLLQKLTDKMITRHPHVFGDASVADAREALRQWEAIKHREAAAKERPASVLEGVPRALPALVRAQRIQTKAARVNFDWPDARQAWAKVQEEVREAGEAIQRGDHDEVAEELGDLFFSLVNVARLSGIEAEESLNGAIEKFRRRFTEMEVDLSARGKSMGDASQEELERSWEAAKVRERRR